MSLLAPDQLSLSQLTCLLTYLHVSRLLLLRLLLPQATV
jgi:hypothetical protein